MKGNQLAKKYRTILLLNLFLLFVPSIILLFVFFSESFGDPADKRTTIVILIIFSVLIVFNIILLLTLKKLIKEDKTIGKLFKVLSLLISVPAFIAMLFKPELSIELLRELLNKTQ